MGTLFVPCASQNCPGRAKVSEGYCPRCLIAEAIKAERDDTSDGGGYPPYINEAILYTLSPLNSESERAAMNWVSENLDDLRDMTTEETAHEGFISGLEWLMSKIRPTGT